jgi:hypothetical protein
MIRIAAATGVISSSPKRRAKATCSARVMSWSRRNSTLCWTSNRRSSWNRPVVVDGIGQVDAGQFGTDGAGQ